MSKFLKLWKTVTHSIFELGDFWAHFWNPRHLYFQMCMRKKVLLKQISNYVPKCKHGLKIKLMACIRNMPENSIVSTSGYISIICTYLEIIKVGQSCFFLILMYLTCQYPPFNQKLHSKISSFLASTYALFWRFCKFY